MQKARDDSALLQHFAAAMPIGTRCRFYPILPADEDAFEESVIRSLPWLLGHGAAVVKIEGRAGGVSIRHVFPIAAGPEA